MLDQSTKVFGIGLSKTGTSSLGLALNDLGISSIHYPHDLTTFQELAAANYRLSLLDSYQSITDIPVAPFYPHLDAFYPGSKFILTVRKQESWLKSIENHWAFMRKWADCDQHFGRFSEFITACVYGAREFERDRFLYVYKKHKSDVLDYFTGRPDDLLVLDICSGEGWEKLCSFLNLPIPEQPYPHANRREEKGERGRWIERLDEAVIEFQATVPADASFILIDENGLAGSELDIPGRTHRIVERQGKYWGSPEDSIQAIEELEALRQAGAAYLVLAWHCQWWLDHYEGFAEYVISRYRSVHTGKQLLVLDLQTPLSA